jgi:hypothetical protein
LEIIYQDPEPANRIEAITVLEVIPVLVDIFQVGMAVTIMTDLTFGSILTMVKVPVLYATVYGVHMDEPASARCA